MFESYKRKGDFIGMDMCRKFLEMDLLVQEDMQITKMVRSIIQTERLNHKNQTHLQVIALSAKIFKNIRDLNV